MHTWHVGSRFYTSDIHLVIINFCLTMAPWHVSTRRKKSYLIAVVERWQPASCRSILETAKHKIRAVKRMVRNLDNRSALNGHNSGLPNEPHWFPSLWTPLRQQAISTDAKVWQSVTSWIKTVEFGYFKCEIQALVLRWNKCLHVSGVYVPVIYIPSSNFVWCTHRI
jgi:hypothetical protein